MKRLFVIGGLIVALGIGFFFGIQIQAKRSSTKHTSELQALERVHQEESAGHASELQALEKISQAETSKLALAEQQADLLRPRKNFSVIWPGLKLRLGWGLGK